MWPRRLNILNTQRININPSHTLQNKNKTLPISFYKAGVSKTRQSHHKKTIDQYSLWHRHKNPQQNTNKPNPGTYKKHCNMRTKVKCICPEASIYRQLNAQNVIVGNYILYWPSCQRRAMEFQQRQEEAVCTQEPKIGLMWMENREWARNGSFTYGGNKIVLEMLKVIQLTFWRTDWRWSGWLSVGIKEAFAESRWRMMADYTAMFEVEVERRWLIWGDKMTEAGDCLGTGTELPGGWLTRF